VDDLVGGVGVGGLGIEIRRVLMEKMGHSREADKENNTTKKCCRRVGNKMRTSGFTDQIFQSNLGEKALEQQKRDVFDQGQVSEAEIEKKRTKDFNMEGVFGMEGGAEREKGDPKRS